MSVPSMRTVVVLPAPFGPRNPNTSPLATLSDRPSTAVRSPKRFVRFSISTRTNCQPTSPLRQLCSLSLALPLLPGLVHIKVISLYGEPVKRSATMRQSAARGAPSVRRALTGRPTSSHRWASTWCGTMKMRYTT